MDIFLVDCFRPPVASCNQNMEHANHMRSALGAFTLSGTKHAPLGQHAITNAAINEQIAQRRRGGSFQTRCADTAKWVYKSSSFLTCVFTEETQHKKIYIAVCSGDLQKPWDAHQPGSERRAILSLLGLPIARTKLLSQIYRQGCSRTTAPSP